MQYSNRDVLTCNIHGCGNDEQPQHPQDLTAGADPPCVIVIIASDMFSGHDMYETITPLAFGLDCAFVWGRIWARQRLLAKLAIPCNYTVC